MKVPEIPAYLGDGKVRLLKIGRESGRKYPVVLKWSTSDHVVIKSGRDPQEEGLGKLQVNNLQLDQNSGQPGEVNPVETQGKDTVYSKSPNDLLYVALALSMSYRLKEVAYLYVNRYVSMGLKGDQVAFQVLEKLKPILTYDKDEFDINKLVSHLSLKTPPTDDQLLEVYRRAHEAFSKAYDSQARELALKVLNLSVSRRKLQAYLNKTLSNYGFRSIVISDRNFVFAGASLPRSSNLKNKKYAVVVGKVIKVLSKYRGHEYFILEVPSPDGKPKRIMVSNSFKEDANEVIPKDLEGKWVLIKGEYIAESGKVLYRDSGEVKEDDLVGVIHFTHIGGFTGGDRKEIGEGIGGFVSLDIDPNYPFRYKLDFMSMNPKMVRKVLSSKLIRNGKQVDVAEFLKSLVREYPAKVSQVPPELSEAYQLISEAERVLPQRVKDKLLDEALYQLTLGIPQVQVIMSIIIIILRRIYMSSRFKVLKNLFPK